jgi:hypothetical protein
MTFLRVISEEHGTIKYYLNGRRATKDRWYDAFAGVVRAGTYNTSFTLNRKGSRYLYCHG